MNWCGKYIYTNDVGWNAAASQAIKSSYVHKYMCIITVISLEATRRFLEKPIWFAFYKFHNAHLWDDSLKNTIWKAENSCDRPIALDLSVW